VANVTPALSLSMPYEAIAAYEKARARRYLPSCVSGMEGREPRNACSKHLKPHAAAFAARNQAFLQEPPEAWYQLVQRLVGERKKDRVLVTTESRRAIGEQYAQVPRIALSTYYMKQIGNADGWFAPIIATEDGGLLIVGTKGSSSDGHFTPGATVPVAVRLDATGKALWERTLLEPRWRGTLRAHAPHLPTCGHPQAGRCATGGALLNVQPAQRERARWH
jgi:hypothetical protein